jgi:hypothetical protein
MLLLLLQVCFKNDTRDEHYCDAVEAGITNFSCHRVLRFAVGRPPRGSARALSGLGHRCTPGRADEVGQLLYGIHHIAAVRSTRSACSVYFMDAAHHLHRYAGVINSPSSLALIQAAALAAACMGTSCITSTVLATEPGL